MTTHTAECRWQQATCAYKDTHHYCPHPEHACNCTGLPAGGEEQNDKCFVGRLTNDPCILGTIGCLTDHTPDLPAPLPEGGEELKPCPFCGGPVDPAGHLCPRANGFRRSAG